MKKFYIVSLCVLVGAASLSASSRFKSARNTARKTAAPKTEAAAAPVMRPSSVTEYEYDPDAEEWLDLGTTLFTYDARGNATVQETEGPEGVFRVTTQYDSHDMPVLVLNTLTEDATEENDSKRTYVYDPVVHDFYTERLGFDWSGTDWVRNYMCETNTITRNDAGNITEIVKALPLAEEMVPAYRAVWSYSTPSGNADGFAYYQYDAWGDTPGWQLYDQTDYRNITWESTDGQMTGTAMGEFLQGANRIKSADVYYDGELDGHFIVEYSADRPADFLARETFADPSVTGRTTRYETLDANGSFRLTESEYFDAETGDPTAEPTYVSIEEVMIDSHGNVLSDIQSETDEEGKMEIFAASRYDLVYDADGNLREMTANEYDYETKEYFPMSRMVYGDYLDVTAGIDSVTAASGETGYTVYNLQGVLVKQAADAASLRALPAGLYIVNGRKQIIR